MRKILIVLALIVLAAAPVSAMERTDVMFTLHQFVEGFNTDDTKTAVAACADDMSIIDEFPPHEWHGPGALLKWFHDYDVDAKKNGITNGIVTLGEPKHMDVTDDRAYVVVPSSYAYKKNGTLVKEADSAFTFALKKSETGWLIIGWSWAKN